MHVSPCRLPLLLLTGSSSATPPPTIHRLCCCSFTIIIGFIASCRTFLSSLLYFSYLTLSSNIDTHTTTRTSPHTHYTTVHVPSLASSDPGLSAHGAHTTLTPSQTSLCFLSNLFPFPYTSATTRRHSRDLAVFAFFARFFPVVVGSAPCYTLRPPLLVPRSLSRLVGEEKTRQDTHGRSTDSFGRSTKGVLKPTRRRR